MRKAFFPQEKTSAHSALLGATPCEMSHSSVKVQKLAFPNFSIL